MFKNEKNQTIREFIQECKMRSASMKYQSMDESTPWAEVKALFDEISGLIRGEHQWVETESEELDIVWCVCQTNLRTADGIGFTMFDDHIVFIPGGPEKRDRIFIASPEKNPQFFNVGPSLSEEDIDAIIESTLNRLGR